MSHAISSAGLAVCSWAGANISPSEFLDLFSLFKLWSTSPTLAICFPFSPSFPLTCSITYWIYSLFMLVISPRTCPGLPSSKHLDESLFFARWYLLSVFQNNNQTVKFYSACWIQWSFCSDCSPDKLQYLHIYLSVFIPYLGMDIFCRFFQKFKWESSTKLETGFHARHFPDHTGVFHLRTTATNPVWPERASVCLCNCMYLTGPWGTVFWLLTWSPWPWYLAFFGQHFNSSAGSGIWGSKTWRFFCVIQK